MEIKKKVSIHREENSHLIFVIQFLIEFHSYSEEHQEKENKTI